MARIVQRPEIVAVGCQAVMRARPLLRRDLMMARPARVRIRILKPCLRFRRRVLGWKVRFIDVLLIETTLRLFGAGCGDKSPERAAHPVHRGTAHGGTARRAIATVDGRNPQPSVSNADDQHSRTALAGADAGRQAGNHVATAGADYSERSSDVAGRSPHPCGKALAHGSGALLYSAIPRHASTRAAPFRHQD